MGHQKLTVKELNPSRDAYVAELVATCCPYKAIHPESYSTYLTLNLKLSQRASKPPE
jgi:hypothetical protein